MPTRRVSEEELRRLFNEGRYYERMLAKEFRTEIVRENPRRRGDRRIRKTRSQIVEYWDEFGVRVAVVHQYRKSDGSLGASGRPDPKRLRHEGVEYVLDERENWDNPDW
jgi:hypothetical protein